MSSRGLEYHEPVECRTRLLTRDMPVVKVDFDGRTCLLVLPRRSSSGAWAWDELRVVPSPLAGLGLACRSTRALDWGKLPYPVLLPYVGRTTVVEHEQEATVLSSVLRGCFRTLPFRRLLRQGGGRWVKRRFFLEQEDEDESDDVESDDDTLPLSSRCRSPHDDALPAEDAAVLQVPLGDGDDGDVDVGERGVVYVVASEVREALHLPPHALALLGAHCKHHHVDRHFDTHVMAYAVGGGRHVLVNSHPVFADAAHIVGNVNESPPDAAPTLESRVGTVVLAAGADAPTRAAWAAWSAAHPPVGGRACFFATTRKAYADGAELTASYGAGYQRHYDAYAGPALRWAARIPPDRVAPADAARLRWPERPGWWHPDAQPLGRPCFRRDAASGEVRLVRDRRTLVLARRLLAGGKRRGVRDDGVFLDEPPRPQKRSRPEMVDEWENEA